MSAIVLAHAVWPDACRAQIVVNEVYYDHPGPDAGHEFVELLSLSPDPLPLSDVAVEFHNGSGEGWSLLWRGAQGVIAPGACFAVGGADVVPAPDVVAGFSLQNGPDALRLVLAGVVVDAVGYGGLDDPAYAETRGAPVAPPGLAIGRVPDGADTDDNGADFDVLRPSPGRPNVAGHDAAVGLRDPTRTRAVRARPGTEVLNLAVVNLGLSPIAAGHVAVIVTDSTEAGARPAAQVQNGSEIPPGGESHESVGVHLSDGYHWLRLRARYSLDERAHNDTLMALRRVGSLGILVSEVLSGPRPECPEFVELYNAGAGPVDLAGFRMRDRSHAPSLATPEATVLAPDGFVVLTPDPAALLRCFRRAREQAVVAFAGTWPTLNVTGKPVADSVVVTDAHGLAVDAVAIPPLPAGSKGRSLERVNLYQTPAAAVWLVSLDPSGATPTYRGERALFDPPPRGGPRVSPNPFAPGAGETTLISVAPAAGVARVTAAVFDLRGREVADLGSASAFPAVFVWDGTDVSGLVVLSGLYVVACESFLDDGRRAQVDKVVVGCDNRTR